MAKLTVTGYNKVPYIADIEVIPAEGPYISVESYNTESTDNVLIPYGQVLLSMFHLKIWEWKRQ